MYNLRRLHFAILSFCPAVGFRLGLAQTKLTLLPFSHYDCSKRKQKQSLSFHHHIKNKTQQQHISTFIGNFPCPWLCKTFLELFLPLQDSLSHIVDMRRMKREKSQTLMAKLWPATPHKLQKLSKLGNYSLNIFPFFYGFLSTLSALQQYPPGERQRDDKAKCSDIKYATFRGTC